MIHVIYMAAGNSHRFGNNKLLYLYEGKPLYRHGLELLLKLKQEMGEKLTVTVVTQYAEILEEVQDIFERCGMAGMQAVFCEESRLGASYTIRAGIEAVISQDPVSGQPKEGQSMIGEKDYLMFMVADQPHLTLDSVRKLVESAVSSQLSPGHWQRNVPDGRPCPSAAAAPPAIPACSAQILSRNLCPSPATREAGKC